MWIWVYPCIIYYIDIWSTTGSNVAAVGNSNVRTSGTPKGWLCPAPVKSSSYHCLHQLTLASKSSTMCSDLGPDRECGGAGLTNSNSKFTKNSANFIEWKCWKVKIKIRQLLLPIKNIMWNGCNFRVITMRGRGIFIAWPCKFKWGRWTQIQTESSGGLMFKVQ